MTGATRRVYIVSDLHLGGAQAAAGERGFQICTQTAALAELIDRLAARNPDNGGEELVIAGDFVDFLAESDGTGENGDPVWKALREDDAVAEQLLHTVAMRSPDVFAALRRFSARGHTLTILLGNHDIELALSAVQAAFRMGLGQPQDIAARLRFERGDKPGMIEVGGARILIGHGEQSDPWNKVDYPHLPGPGAPQSADAGSFRYAAGSRLVKTIMKDRKSVV